MRAKNIFINLSLSIAAVVVALLIIELLCSIGSRYFYRRLIIQDDLLGWKYRPTAKKITRRFDKDIVYDISINSEGFRDDEFSNDKNIFKIMLLGDSMTFGLETSQEKIFSNIIEKKLISLYPGINIDVMNFGVTGFSTAQELLCLREYGGIYNPDIVALILFAPNDFLENTLTMSSGRFHPHFLITNGKLKLYGKPNKTQKILTFLRDRSFLMYILSNRLKSTRKVFTRKIALSEKEKILLMERLLGQMHNYTRDKNINFIIFYVRNDKRPDSRSKYKEIRQFCKTNSIPIKEILLVPKERVYGKGHWNDKGHETVAKIIYSELSKRNLLPAEK